MAEEKTLENKIKKWLDLKGIYHFKYHGNMYSQAGVADLTLCVNGKFIAAEIKAEKGVVSDLQEYNLRKVRESGGVGIVVRPSTFEMFKAQIEALLND